jgi:hypothetical protein
MPFRRFLGWQRLLDQRIREENVAQINAKQRREYEQALGR